MSDHQAVPLQLLAQMMAEMATMHCEQVVAQSRHHHGTALPSTGGGYASEGDDPQVFLKAFQTMEEVCQWPAAEEALRLLLSGEAQTKGVQRCLPGRVRSPAPFPRRSSLLVTGSWMRPAIRVGWEAA